jgi:hypothetical protein
MLAVSGKKIGGGKSFKIEIVRFYLGKLVFR